MSTFDPDTFLHSVKTSAAMATEYPTIPDGDYRAMIINDAKHPMKVRQSPRRDGSGISTIVDLFYKIDAPGNKDADGRFVRQSLFLDLDEAGNLDSSPDRNVGLGQLRAAVGQNQAGETWGFHKLEGAVCIVKVKTTPAEKDGKQVKYTNVEAVSRL
jgi:hypothetical protein